MSSTNIFFENRFEATKKLIEELPIDGMKLEEWIVLSSSYNSYEIAKDIAKELNSEFDIILNKKIYAPNNEECEIAVVTEYEDVFIHEELIKSFDINIDYIYYQSKNIFEYDLKDQGNRFRDGAKHLSFEGKNVLIVDEDINVGLVMMACIKTVINQKVKSISVATPIISSASIEAIDAITDDLYYVKKLDHYIEAEYYYKELPNLEFEDILKIKKGQ
jgi:putative phosphoribosyl transferase